MTKADIIEKVYEKTGLPKNESSGVVEQFFEILKGTLEKGEKIKVSGFGNFEVPKKADRRGRNPQTGKAITIEARRIITFKPSAVLKQRLNM